MKKYGILCPIRKANPYKRMIKATKEHIILPNLLNRNFKQGIPGKVLLTDITYIFYGNGRKAYLSIATLTGVNLMLLSPDEIEEKANRDGDFLYLRFKEKSEYLSLLYLWIMPGLVQKIPMAFTLAEEV
jgi:hypothetical protein